jgi:hypothetical protein
MNSSLQHLCVFGYEAYVHMPKEKWLKLDRKTMKCIFIGYGTGVKGYKFWDFVSRKFVYSRNVIFIKFNPFPQ